MNTLVTLVVLVGCFAGLNALTCQTCSYTEGVGGDSKCGDPFTGNFSVTCISSQDRCQKTTGKADGTIKTYARTCASSVECPKSETCVSLLGIEACQYCCSADGCNGASAVTFTLATMTFTVLGAFLAC